MVAKVQFDGGNGVELELKTDGGGASCCRGLRESTVDVEKIYSTGADNIIEWWLC